MELEMVDALVGSSLVFMIIIVIIASFILVSFPMFLLAKKANHHTPVWAFIPILNSVQMIQVARLNWWFILLMFIPYVSFIISIYIVFRYLEAFDSNGILMVLFVIFIPVIPYYYLAFSDNVRYKY